MLGCFNRGERDKGVYSSVPAIREREGPEERQRTESRRRLWLKAIARDDLTQLKIKYQRVCWQHFVHGELFLPFIFSVIGSHHYHQTFFIPFSISYAISMCKPNFIISALLLPCHVFTGLFFYY